MGEDTGYVLHSVHEELVNAIAEYEKQVPIQPGTVPDFSGVVSRLQAMSERLNRVSRVLAQTQRDCREAWKP
jgi:hypothetical protein